jgi:hypothetical protein
MNSLYLNNNEFSYFCKEYGGSKTRMSSSFLWLPPDPRHARRYTRGRTCGVCASEGRTKAVPCVPCGRAWQRRSEDGATPRRGYSIPSKKVRAKDSISAHAQNKNTTSNVWYFCFRKQPALLSACVPAADVFLFQVLETKTVEAGSSALTILETK